MNEPRLPWLVLAIIVLISFLFAGRKANKLSASSPATTFWLIGVALTGAKILRELGQIETALRNPIAHASSYANTREAAVAVVRATRLVREWIALIRRHITDAHVGTAIR